MQHIVFEFNVRVDPKMVNKDFSLFLQEILKRIPGVEEVSGPWFTFEIYIARPEAEAGKSISNEIAHVLKTTFGVTKVREVSWSRY